MRAARVYTQPNILQLKRHVLLLLLHLVMCPHVCHFQSHNPWRNTLFSTLDLTLVQPNLININHRGRGEIGDSTQLLPLIGWNCMLWRDMYQWHRLLKADFLYCHLAVIMCTQSSYEVIRFNVTADDHHRVKMYTLHLLQLQSLHLLHANPSNPRKVGPSVFRLLLVLHVIWVITILLLTYRLPLSTQHILPFWLK